MDFLLRVFIARLKKMVRSITPQKSMCPEPVDREKNLWKKNSICDEEVLRYQIRDNSPEKKGLVYGNGYLVFTALTLMLSGCSRPRNMPPSVKTPSPLRATSRPYVIKNKLYVPQRHFELVQTGVASYYGGRDGCHGAKTALGEPFNMFHLSAAHKTLPLPSMIMVQNLENGKKVVLRVNDRGPFACNRILDVSMAAARELGFYHKGSAKVRIYTLVRESVGLLENKPGFRRKSTKASEVPNLLHRRYYVKVASGPLHKVKVVQKAVGHLGKIDVRKTKNQFHVLMGPYSTRWGAVQVCQRMPSVYSPRVVCEGKGRSASSSYSGARVKEKNQYSRKSSKKTVRG